MGRSFHSPGRFLALLMLLRPPRRPLTRLCGAHPGDPGPEAGLEEKGSLSLPAPALPGDGDEPYDRMQCLGCGRIIAVRQERLSPDMDDLTRTHGFKISGHRLTLFGFCPRCQGRRQ